MLLAPGSITRRAGWEGGLNLSGFSRTGEDDCCCCCFCLPAEGFFALAELGEVVEKPEDCWRTAVSSRCRCRPALLLRRVRVRAEEAGIPLGARN